MIEDEPLVFKRRPSAKQLLRLAVYVLTGGAGIITLGICVLTWMEQMPWDKKYATDAFIGALVLLAGPYGYFFNRDLKRQEFLDEKFPDLLRDIASSARAGMTLPRALVTASKGSYGALSVEIKKMAAQVEWGIDFGEAMRRFAERANTTLIHRIVALVDEAARAGGDVVAILTVASEDAREIKQIVKERNEQMKMYSVVVLISYFVFITVVLILSAQFIPAFKAAVVPGGGGAAPVGGLALEDFDAEKFNTIFFHAGVLQAIGGGLVSGVLTRGHPVAGFSTVAVMLAAAWISFRIILGGL